MLVVPALMISALCGAFADNTTREDLFESALMHSPEYTSAVLNADGSPVAVFRDLNGDQRTDLAVVAVLSEPGVPTSAELLRAPSRLFDTSNTKPLFVIETYFAGDESVQTVELGRKRALGEIELVSLTVHQDFPVGVLVQTRSLEGTETNLLVYSRGGTVRRISLQDTERERHQIVDLDGDGVLDILQSRRLPEAGRGYETFIELLSLSGTDYEPAGSFAVVREVSGFLDAATGHMTNGRWADLAELVEVTDTSVEDRISAAFVGVPDGESTAPRFDYVSTGDSVTAVVFPAIMESPFPFPHVGRHVVLEFRVECCGDFPRFYAATIRMSANPFSGPPFLFLTDDGRQQ